MTNYKIIGKPVFGNGQVDKSGMMDETQFASCVEIDYRKAMLINGTEQHYAEYAGSLISAVQMYGAKPCCKIDAAYGTIDVYAVPGGFTFLGRSHDGWINTNPYVYENTVNPAAIVRWFNTIVKPKTDM